MIRGMQKKASKTIVLILAVFVLLSQSIPVYAASVTAPAKVTAFKSSTRTTSSIKLTWSKVTGAAGYQIYRKLPAGKEWKKIATVQRAKKSYINTGLKQNTKYQYKIRAYKTYKVGEKTKYKYGKYSTVITVSTKKILKTVTLQTGYYTAGVDIPAGVFDVTALAGIGFISSENDSANLRGPEYKKTDFDEYSRSYRNFKIGKGDILEVRDLKVKLSYSKITLIASGRQYDKSAAIKLTPGHYKVGTDIEPGRYCVKYISGGGGYVGSSRYTGTCIMDANMDGDPNTGDYGNYVSNVILKKGEKIEITSGLSVLFIPEA